MMKKIGFNIWYIWVQILVCHLPACDANLFNFSKPQGLFSSIKWGQQDTRLLRRIKNFINIYKAHFSARA